MKRMLTIAAASLLMAGAAFAGQAKTAAPAPAAQTSAQPAAGITPPADYVIGVGDVLSVNYWQEPTMTVDNAVVRPDGMITLPLLKDVPAAGLKPEQLGDRLQELSSKQAGLVDPRVSVLVRAINSRKVYISGGINKPGPYDLNTPMRVYQLLTVAGGLKEFVGGENIMIVRDEGGKQRPIRFNMKEFQAGKRLEQNIMLMPGDQILVPE